MLNSLQCLHFLIYTVLKFLMFRYSDNFELCRSLFDHESSVCTYTEYYTI